MEGQLKYFDLLYMSTKRVDKPMPIPMHNMNSMLHLS